MDEIPKLRSLSVGRLRRLKYQMKLATNHPYIGVTQGGSSREFAGCVPAATRGLAKKPPKPGVKYD